MHFIFFLVFICWSVKLQAIHILHKSNNVDGERMVRITQADQLPNPATENVVTLPPFWVSTEMRSIRWKRNCLTTMLCSEPRFTLANAMPKFNEKVASDWSISKTILSEISPSSPSYLQLYTYWTRGEPEDVSVQLYVFGTDPVFRFNRLCDETPNVHVFPRRHNSANKNIEQTHKLEDEAGIVLELHGNCFNATLHIRKHTLRCPWCPMEVPESRQKVTQSSLQHTGSFFSSSQNSLKTKALIGFLAAITIINTIAFVGILLMCLFKWKKGRVHNKKVFLTPSSSQISAVPAKDPGLQPSSQQSLQKYPYSLPPVGQCTLISTMPSIHEEDYEMIRDESFLPSLHPCLGYKTSKRTNNKGVVVQLPTSRRCDHCFLGASAFGGEECSCSPSPNSSAFDSSRESDSGLESHFDGQN